MNATVTRIVDLMFEDLLKSDEVNTLHDEVMANCQARFQDCVSRGLTEDEAIGAVVESLKGMEDVLAAYPKQEAFAGLEEKQPDATYHRHGLDQEYSYSAGVINSVRISLSGEDVTILPSDDGRYHVTCEAGDVINVYESGDMLVIDHGYAAGNMQMNVNGKTVEATVREAKIGSIAELLKNVFSHIGVYSNGAEVSVYLPAHLSELDAHTTSGDIKLRGVTPRLLKCTSASGDITVKANQHCESAVVTTASGDLDISLAANELRASTMSGNLTFRGDASQAQLSTVSGDLTVEGSVNGTLKSVSGDVELTTGRACVNAITTSGDIELAADEGATVYVTAKTTSGKVSTRANAVTGEQSDVVMHAATTSGDITVS